MKLTKKLEAEILMVYHGYFDSYFRGDIQHFGTYVDKDYRVIGTSEVEVLTGKKEMLAFYEATKEEIVGRAEFRNRNIEVVPVDGLMLVVEFCDVYILVDDTWRFYSKARISTFLRQTGSGWKVINQHTSLPDSKPQEGETVGFEQIQKENLQLREAVKRRTIELEQKNRELEIETSLERVRSMAMSINKPDDLAGVSAIIFEELKTLGIPNLRNTEIIINKDDRQTIISYYYSDYGVTGTIELDYTSNPVVQQWARDVKKASNAFAKVEISPKEMAGWRKYREEIGYRPDPKLEKAEAVYYYSYSTGLGALSISTFKAISAAAVKLLERFRNVFALAYRRYADVVTAEEQAREARVEAALEKVRSRTAGMQKSEELKEVIQVVYEQMVQLNLFVEHAGFIMDYKERDDMHIWLADEKGAPAEVTTPYFDSVAWNRFNEAKEQGLDFFAVNLTFEEKNEHYDKLFQFIPELPADAKDFYMGCPGLAISTVLLDTVCLYIENFSGTPYPDEDNNTFKRFGKVFQQTYARFRDLQKAEEQAREGQIELSLERVRARTMAMQESHELGDVATLLFSELNQLVDNLWTCGFVLCEKGRREDEWWLSTEEGFIPAFFLPNTVDVTHENIFKAWERGETYHTEQLEGKALQEHYDWLMNIPASRKVFEDMFASGLTLPTWQKLHCAYFSYGYLVMITEVPCPEEQIFKRFAQVFDQTYTRFLDLQKAEAQAREAQIEASLERVRAHALGLRNSEEFQNVIAIIFDELKKLGLLLYECGIYIRHGKTRDFTFWGSNADSQLPTSYLFHFFDHPILNHVIKDLDDKVPFREFIMDSEELREYGELLFAQSAFKHAPQEYKDEFFSLKKAYVAQASMQHGMLEAIGTEPLPGDLNDVLVKFTRVIDLSYTRFLDIQKAETRAREAQIDAALERVRSRSMAMHKSEELAELSLELVKQVQALGVDTWFCAFNIYDDDPQGSLEWGSNGQGTFPKYRTPREGIFLQYYEAGKRGETLFIHEIGEQECPGHYDYLCTLPGVGEQLLKMKDAGIPFPSAQIDHVAFFKYGYILFITFEPAPEAHDIFKRFARVFEQTYTRFLDLQKAEAQAREAQIEAALERTRTQSMLMQHSSELEEVSKVFHQQLLLLDIPSEFSYVWLPDEPNEKHLFWATWEQKKGKGSTFQSKAINYDLDKTEPYTAACFTAWESDEAVHQNLIPPDEVDHFFTTWSELILGAKHLKPELFPEGLYYTEAYMKYGCFGINIRRELDREEQEILRRFAVQFERTYTRFLDLKKAEAQAREAEIEASLERVRSRTMGMQQSDELAETVSVLFKQLLDLGVDSAKLRTCGIVTFKENRPEGEVWISDINGDIIPESFVAPYDEAPAYKKVYSSWKKGETFLELNLKGEAFFEHLGYVKKYSNLANIDLAAIKKAHTEMYFHVMYFSQGYLFVISYEALTEFHEIFKRFGSLFQQTYTRFLDFKKAEAQAREAQIETALERVRSKTMAMHNSEDVGETVITLFEEVMRLGLDPSIRCGIGILDKATDYMETRSANSYPNGEVDFKMGMLDMRIHPMLVGLKKAWEKGEPGYSYDYIGEDVHRYYEALSKEPKYPFKVNLDSLPENEYHNSFFFTEGILFAFTETRLSEEAKGVLNRFAAVFGQTYRRYLDLRKAEAQAREALIEASLERVRARSMAMHTSEEMMEVIQIIFQELSKLGFDVVECSIVTYDTNPKDLIYWSSGSYATDKPSRVKFQYIDHPILVDLFKDLENGVQYRSREFSGELLRSWWDRIFAETDFKYTSKEIIKSWKKIQHVYYEQATMNHGFLEFLGENPLPDEKVEILKRFTRVVDLTYTRFDDVKKAEAQAREAQIEAALERVRARALAMQEPEELKAVADVMRDEMGKLGVEELETSSIYINDASAEKAECWYALKDLRKEEPILVNDYFALNLSDTLVGREMLKFYQSKKQQVSIPMTGKARIEWIRYCEERSAPLRGYYGDVIPDRTYHLYKFSHGAIGAATAGDISDEHWGLLKRAASAFSLAYSRFKDLTQARNDLRRLKEAKKRAEEALSNLEATQEQLVHAEKMASLGELTAGIAHEIQNPLNFVNNFSEVNAELIEELTEELEKGDLEEVRAIIKDILGNEEKIRHHGKRADDIVKGMLQHSRTTSGKKELTDINLLADEYLRLAYHGLRAKDKSFNADFGTQLDEKLPRVKAISQDIGRVLLNMINNAFYAVDKRAKEQLEGYKPRVTVTTRLVNSQVEIRVKDNGPGIPREVLTKIFQPFFTTKPTGEGTGLGLSLSYDIITKGHGGQLTVETKENEGAEFIIQIPANTKKNKDE